MFTLFLTDVTLAKHQRWISLDPTEAFLSDLSDDSFSARIASGGGRMQITMDRYQANWSMVGKRMGPPTSSEKVSSSILPMMPLSPFVKEPTRSIRICLPYVIAEDGVPVGTIEDGDSVIPF